MYYPSFYTTPQYYSFATDPTDEFLQLRDQANKAKGPTQGNFQKTPLPRPPPNQNDQPVTGLVKQWYDNITKALTTPSANNPQINGVGKTVVNQTIDFFQCKTFGLSPELCQYAPYILLGVGALLVYALLKYII